MGNQLGRLELWIQDEVRYDIVFVLTHDEVFKVKGWSLVASLRCRPKLDVEPNVLIYLELEHLRLFLKSVFAFCVFNHPQNDKLTGAIGVHCCELFFFANHLA